METKDEQIQRIGVLVAQVAARFGDEDADERQHMLELCSPAGRRILPDLSVQALHLIAAIPADDDVPSSVNVVGLARISGVPKGTVSKALQRFTTAGLVTRHRLPDNRKEVHVRLTDVGKEIRAAHRSLHEQMGQSLDGFLERYSGSDLAVIDRVLSDLLRMPRENLRFRPDLLD